ncbi:facilitated trehalose transporter Tret1-2 homolog isoform X2 [Macrosteles quadrilineatus]|uniref:facilitated trehalose transporter Tret1-2 homolog isoform X2 n=1 Tax=Macrosteles quadrilineatus TaxID=74068 RepID=UPI0023E2241C|nr:facilitated trehalose transporter Tret1-2 homolog isoform X2 [Macrosteles quadrilineatus]
MTDQEPTKPEESEKWLRDPRDGAVIISQVSRSGQRQTMPAREGIGSFGSAVDMGTSCFDITFKPTEEVTHYTVWPQDHGQFASCPGLLLSSSALSVPCLKEPEVQKPYIVRDPWTSMLACISAASYHFPVGAVVAFSAILIPQLTAEDSEIKVTKSDTSWIASLVVLVVPVGALITGYLVDKIGRLNTIKVGAIPYMIGWVLIATAQNLPMLLVGRFLTGFAMAMGPSPAVVYITEVARADLRGALICTGPSMTSLGMVVIYAQGAYLHWRTIAWMSIAWCLVPILMMSLWSPESPIWLISKGRTQDALKSLTYLSRRDKKAGVAEQQLAELLKEHNAKKSLTEQKGSSFGKLVRAFLRPNGYKPLLLLVSIFTFQQFSGIYITIFYAVNFFKDVGADIDPYVSTVAIGVVRMCIGLLTSFLLRSFGRRPLYMVSGTGMAVFMFICGYITREVSEGRMEKSFTPVICILIYMSLGVTGLMSIPWTMTAELYPLEIRGMAQGLTISLAHLIMFAALKVYPFLENILGGTYATHWLFAGSSLASVVFIFIFLPETHKKLLSDIQDYFLNNTVYILSKDKPREVKPPTDEGVELTKMKENV